jgi:PTH1 family peptidyl-tRNA hydrolase
MKVILGLGNPGAEYAETRHNVGWWVVDHLAEVWRCDGWRKDGDALTSTGQIGSTKLRLIKPQTFMNLSGRVLSPWRRRPFWAAATDLLVISDEVQLPVGAFRFRARGSAGGHNGLKSIEQALGSQEYARLRIGVGPNDPQRRIGDLADYVLGRFGKDEGAEVRALLPKVEEGLRVWLTEGILPAMNRCNQ